MYWGNVGRGCHHCEEGHPIGRFEQKSGLQVALCLDCLLAWFPGKDAAWFEEQHTPLQDHLYVAFKRGAKADEEHFRQWCEDAVR